MYICISVYINPSQNIHGPCMAPMNPNAKRLSCCQGSCPPSDVRDPQDQSVAGQTQVTSRCGLASPKRRVGHGRSAQND